MNIDLFLTGVFVAFVIPLYYILPIFLIVDFPLAYIVVYSKSITKRISASQSDDEDASFERSGNAGYIALP